ncbi:MAG TPA: hypothetical protein VN260_05075, partial [Dissulfurispiraceae bacterium]|nr:hypothetical protein [Dissulfurispiraceae bacterium]
MASCDPETFRLAAIEKIFEAPFSTATGVRLLPKGRDSFHTIFSALREAKTLICLEFYIFRNDETGR